MIQIGILLPAPIKCLTVELMGMCPSQAIPGGSDDKESACNTGDLVQSLGQEDPLEKGKATHSIILAWRIPWTEEPGGLQFVGLQRVGHD